MISIFLLFLVTSCMSTSYQLKKQSFAYSSKLNSEKTNSNRECRIHVDYPKLTGSRDKIIEEKINQQLRSNFLEDVKKDCVEDSILDTEVFLTYNEYENDLGILSIISRLTISGEVSAVKIEGYNIELTSGRFLSKYDLIDKKFHNEINSLLIKKIDSSMKYNLDDLFFNAELIFSSDNAIFYLPQVGLLGPYELKIKITEIKKFINKKYLR